MSYVNDSVQELLLYRWGRVRAAGSGVLSYTHHFVIDHI